MVAERPGIDCGLERLAISVFRLPLHGVHGVLHWARVCRTGWNLARSTGADMDVVEVFALLHDVCRISEELCLQHGALSAEMIFGLGAEWNRFLSKKQVDQILFAVRYHTDGKFAPDSTVAACWDADRLDIGRVGEKVNPSFLFSDAAKEVLKNGNPRGTDSEVIDWIRETWPTLGRCMVHPAISWV